MVLGKVTLTSNLVGFEDTLFVLRVQISNKLLHLVGSHHSVDFSTLVEGLGEMYSTVFEQMSDYAKSTANILGL